jgi:MFS superfamily sulfate permease-like transporter
MVDGAGGRSQLAMLTTSFIVLMVLLLFTKPLQYMPSCVLSTVVFLIGVEQAIVVSVIDHKQAYNELQRRGVKLVISEASDSVRAELDRCGATALLGADAYYPTMVEAVAAFQQQPPN